ncbi:MAG: hypothetical protein U0790_26930 [Isosphaeraceae bacterium]
MIVFAAQQRLGDVAAAALAMVKTVKSGVTRPQQTLRVRSRHDVSSMFVALA